MIEAVRNLHALGVPLAEAVEAATVVPARVLGLPELGRLDVGLAGRHRGPRRPRSRSSACSSRATSASPCEAPRRAASRRPQSPPRPAARPAAALDRAARGPVDHDRTDGPDSERVAPRAVRAGQVGGVILFGRNIGTPAELTRRSGSSSGRRVRRQPAAPDRRRPGRRRGQTAAVRAPDLSPRDLGDRPHRQGRSEGGLTGRICGGSDQRRPRTGPGHAQLAQSFLGSRAFSRDPAPDASDGRRLLARASRTPALPRRRSTFRGSEPHGHHRHDRRPGARAARSTRDSPRSARSRRRRPGDGEQRRRSRLRPDGTPAVLSPRSSPGSSAALGFRGVVITDEIEAPGPASRGDAAVIAVNAGVDVLLYTSERDSGSGVLESWSAPSRAARYPPGRCGPVQADGAAEGASGTPVRFTCRTTSRPWVDRTFRFWTPGAGSRWFPVTSPGTCDSAADRRSNTASGGHRAHHEQLPPRGNNCPRRAEILVPTFPSHLLASVARTLPRRR